jgi:hypothetical protein
MQRQEVSRLLSPVDGSESALIAQKPLLGRCRVSVLRDQLSPHRLCKFMVSLARIEKLRLRRLHLRLRQQLHEPRRLLQMLAQMHGHNHRTGQCERDRPQPPHMPVRGDGERVHSDHDS